MPKDNEHKMQPRAVPQDLATEQHLIGAMLLSKVAVAEASEVIHPDDCFKPAHAHIMEAIFHLFAKGEVVDPITVARQLSADHLLDAVGGAATLVELQTYAPMVKSPRRYAQIVSDLASLRRLIMTGERIAELGYSMPEDVGEAIDKAEAMLFELAPKTSTELESTAQLFERTIDAIEQRRQRGSIVTGFPTGLPELDNVLLGLQPNALIVLGGRPAMGKSSLANGMVKNGIERTGLPGVIFNLEMSKQEIMERLFSDEADIVGGKLRAGAVSDDEMQRMRAAGMRLADLPLFIDDNPSITVLEMRSKCRRLKALRGQLGVVTVDYVQLMTGRNQRESREREVAEISRGLKIMARELQCPVVALAQLNRELEKRADKRPMLSDLRESGALEQDADVVLFAYRDHVYFPGSDPNHAEILIAKHRAGPTGVIDVRFEGSYTRFLPASSAIAA